MKAPKHIRAMKAKVRQVALDGYQSDKANGMLDRTGKTAKGLDVGGRPVNIGFRSSPNLLMGYTFHQPMNAKGVTVKRRKSSLTDDELYLGGLDKDVKRGEARIRVGTTPSHMVPIKDKLTGDTKLVRVKAKAKWQDVGTSGITPKDGGKDG